MESLHLLEKHRQKMGLIFAFIVQAMIYLSIFLSQFLYLYFHMKYTNGSTYGDIFNELINTIVILIIIAPFLYALFAYIGCRIMHKIYKPIKEVVGNLEGFAENINHEFKTSLTEIISTIDLAKVTKDYEENIDRVGSSAKRLSKILDSLSFMIHFVNVDYRKEKIDVINFLDKSINDYKFNLEEKNIKIIKKYDENKPIIKYIDSAPLLLCFSNILKNAIRYSNDNGTIEIEITKNYFSIKDYGVGISDENKQKIFDRHFRESYSGEGFGLGLSMVKKISDVYNWKIDLKSKKNEFTIVKIIY